MSDDPPNALKTLPTGEPEAVVLRAKPPRVMRLSPLAIGTIAAGGLALIGGALIYALLPEERTGPAELFNTDGAAVAEQVAASPRDYGEAARLGPPLPSELGVLDEAAVPPAETALMPPLESPPANQAPSRAEMARERAAQEREAARASRLFFAGSTANAANTDSGGAADTGSETAGAAPPPRAAEVPAASAEQMTLPPSTSVLQAGSIIPAALITGIRSDLPGLVTAQVTQNVYDSRTGRHLLIPQGARLIGEYSADVGFGQRRVMLAWIRLILPDGRSVTLERLPAADARGFAGLEDSTDFHWGGVFKAALVSTLLGIGGELGAGDDSEIARALRRGAQDSIGRTGEAVVSRELGVRPTLTIRPGFPVRVLVTRDLVLEMASSR